MLEVRNVLKESEDSGNLEGEESGNHEEGLPKTTEPVGDGQKGRKKKLTKKAQKPEEEEVLYDSVNMRLRKRH